LPNHISIYFDLVEMGLREDIQTASSLEMLEFWVDRQNRKMFEYEVKSGDKTKIKRDYPYLVKGLTEKN
jgi:hypothetical protein